MGRRGSEGYSVLFFKQKTAYEITEGDWSSDVCSSDLDEWPRGDDRFAGECTRHPHDAFHHLPEEGPRHAHGGSPLRDPRRESRGGTRLRVRDLGRRRPGGRSRDGPLATRASRVSAVPSPPAPPAPPAVTARLPGGA